MKPLALLQESEEILVVRTDGIGDMICTLPLCASLKKEFPRAKLSVFASHRSAELLSGFSFIDHVEVKTNSSSIHSFLARHNVGAVFFPRPQFDEAWSAFRARIPLRVGSVYRAYSFLYNHRIHDHRKESRFHEVEYNCRMLGSIVERNVSEPLPRLVVESTARIRLRNVLENIGVQTNHLSVVIHAGGLGSAPRWSVENFRRLNEELSRQTNITVIVTGIEKERDMCDFISSGSIKTINLCDQLSLPELAALIEVAGCLICNSTGVAHIAASLQTPTICLMGNSPSIGPQRWRPLSEKTKVLTPFLREGVDPNDLNTISVETVLSETIKLISLAK